MRRLVPIIGLLLIIAGCARAPEPQLGAASELPARIAIAKAPPSSPSVDVEGEAARLREALASEVPAALVDTPAEGRTWIALSRAAVTASNQSIDRAQILVVVDRNPDVQQLRLVLARSQGTWQDLGGSEVSTGEWGRRGYYVTPTGVFPHTDLILDWRAAGTFNAQHIRGLGRKGMRVWDFGWQEAARGWGTQEEGEIRLLMHATDPDYLEQRLGHSASKGCVRIPDAMNRFLDRHGILDADYERAAPLDRRFAALLLPDRQPTPLAGNMLVVIDSAGQTRPRT
jgi:hypothetical protein